MPNPDKRGAARRHVVPRADGQWGVEKPGASRASAVAPTQKAAEGTH